MCLQYDRVRLPSHQPLKACTSLVCVIALSSASQGLYELGLCDRLRPPPAKTSRPASTPITARTRRTDAVGGAARVGVGATRAPTRVVRSAQRQPARATHSPATETR